VRQAENARCQMTSRKAAGTRSPAFWPPAAPVVAKRDEQVARALSRLWDRIRAEDSRMPEITVGLTPSRSSSCSSVGWDSEPIVELNLQRDGENLTGRELLEYLLHQGAHGRSARSRPAKGDSTLRLTGTRRPGWGSTSSTAGGASAGTGPSSPRAPSAGTALRWTSSTAP
jgi:hypothetical protein